MVFPEELAADPIVTLPTVNLVGSKFRSKLTIETSTPPWGSSMTATGMPASPGSADALSTVRTATGPCAAAFAPNRDTAITNTEAANRARFKLMVLDTRRIELRMKVRVEG